jgi:hypothetical protein
MIEENDLIEESRNIVVENKSEEVQAIIDRMPTYWVKWVALCVIVLMAILIILSFIIQYPDTVDGEITITAQLAPVRLVAKSSAMIHLLKPNKALLEKGEVIAYLENGAKFNDILLLDSILQGNELDKQNPPSFPETLLLGDVSSSYNSFALSYSIYNRLMVSDIYENMLKNIQNQIEADNAIIVNVSKEINLNNQILQNSAEQLAKDSILLSINGLSEKEYIQIYTQHLSLKESKLSLESTRLLKQSEINKNKLEMARIRLQHDEEIQKAFSELVARKNELLNAINLWKERYLLFSPIEGELEYLGFWRENTFVQSGEELFTVIPNKNNIVGELMIPATGAGKVEIGQSVNIKISKFPYYEYGIIIGRVESVSRITNKIKIQDGFMEAYQVIISFPNGMVTNFNRNLALDFETKGGAEIITRRKRLIERLFDNLKANTVK